MFYGQGAGKLPTASAVVGDIIDAAKHLKGTRRSQMGMDKRLKFSLQMSMNLNFYTIEKSSYRGS